MMSEDQLAARLAERMMTATHPVGHLKLRIYIAWKRSAWKFAIGFTRFVKRAMDVVSSGILIIVLSPLMIVVALLIRRDGGPVFFKQKRVGYRGQEFGMLKFRSMCVDAEAKLKDLLAQNEKGDGITFKMKNDPRITPIGRFIRKVSIDELPQLFNVLRGEMSLVGPRPPLIREVALYSPDDRRRLLATPGITCLWQVGEREGRLFEVGDRNQIEFPEQVNLDVRYIESQSVWKDIMILLKTVPAVLLGKGGL
ncbi:MAG: sugar transferase [Akkermansiaceae bacterium]|jgi:lipopolysaccharide/colanic/teichoic acid biosynthesis glycosyltransferase